MAQSDPRPGSMGAGTNAIERHEQPPVTDAEWAIALRLYGNDRRLGHPSLDTCLDQSATPSPLSGTAAKRSQLLIHNENDDDDDDDDEDNDTAQVDFPDVNDPAALRRERARRNYGFGSWGGDVHVLSGTAADAPVENSTTNRPTSPSTSTSFPQRQPPFTCDKTGSQPKAVDDLAFTQLTPHAAIGAFERQYKFVESVSLPRSIKHVEDGSEGSSLCQESERGRIRAFYEANGWLPAPNPSRDTRLRRSRAIRRLGLNDADDDRERYAVISKFVELAQLTFGTDGAAVTVLRGDTEDVYPCGIENSRYSYPMSDALAGHVVLNPEGRCFVVADMAKDWRLQNNPNRRRGLSDQRFFASAPLRYHRPSGDFVDFGTLSVVDSTQRDVFTQREQGILLRLANMLVYQLATLQSEIVAKRSSHMYESSINFLRRSLIPEHLKTGPDVADAEKADDVTQPPPRTKERQRKRTKDRTPILDVPRPKTQPSAATLSVLTAPTASTPLPAAATELTASINVPGTPTRPPLVRATKSGPRDSQRAKRKDLRAENAMFNDAADTLRRILRADGVCMVDLHEFQLYIRKGGSRKDFKSKQTKESIVSEFLQGKEWPRNVEPVVKHAPRSENPGVEIMGQSGAADAIFDFDKPEAITTLAEFIKEYFTNRHFWWDCEDPSDKLAHRLMCFMPHKTQTLLASVFMTHNGTLRHATFISWERPPANFDDSSRLALPFVWIIGAALASGLAVTRVRNVEESQITYSNLQAHELRTPLHQILAITQLLRSSMSDLAEGASLPIGPRGCMNTLEQVRDLLPFLDAIDTSGKTLHGIVDNILTFLDLTASDNRWESARAKHPIFGQRSSAPQTFGAMMEDLVREAFEEHRRSGIGAAQAQSHIETVFEIIPKGLSDIITEDSGGALRRALGRLINNAYRFIDGPGCVEIYVDDVKDMLPPEGYEDLSNTRRIAIHIIDNGRGMALDFVDNKLGEPWAKEDLYATGSGLSVHLAYRIVDIMGGHMKISSAPGHGTIVTIEVPVPVKRPTSPSPESPIAEAPKRKIALLGFNRPEDERCGLEQLGASLERQYKTLGCEFVAPEEAEIVVVDGGYGAELNPFVQLSTLTASNIVIFESDYDTASQLPWPSTTHVRRLRKPITPALVRSSLESAPPAPVNSPELDAMGRVILRPRFEPVADASQGKPTNGLMSSWKGPRGVCVEDAVASLCLGDYFSSRTRTSLLPSSASSGTSHPTPPLDDRHSFSPVPLSESPPTPYLGTASASTAATTPSEEDLPPPPKVKVLVVEDNVINRKILVKILTTHVGGPGLDIIEAGDGQDAVDLFRNFDAPAIVLLDINMPRMDGYAAAVEMRLIEKRKRGEAGETGDGVGPYATYSCSGYSTPMNRSKIFAVTALAGEDEKRRGLVESGMDMWLTKPCPKATLQKVVEEARREIVQY